eukprot:Phypoly_transcript_16747.p1 GENE.Phypoly_transcript_16747~~Phypoly_transcript_16747.p1  ORF type:complete len:254 (+),score=25.42 Phypoly_transcript_16747:72-833(+)
MDKLKVTFCLIFLTSLFTISYSNCFEDPYAASKLQHAQNDIGACDWYNGKNACPSCRGLSSQNISLQSYQALHEGSIAFECDTPPEDCRDYLIKFLCGIHCSPLLIQMVPSDNSSSSMSSSSVSDEPQTTVCQYFADRMWEKCHEWRVKDTATGECVSLKKKFGNAKGYYQSISGGYLTSPPVLQPSLPCAFFPPLFYIYISPPQFFLHCRVMIWAPGMPKHNKITNCFNSTAVLSPSFFLTAAIFLLLGVIV